MGAAPARSSASAWRRASQSTGRRLSGSTSEKRPELVALVDVGHARRGELQQQLGQGGALPGLDHALGDGLEVPQEGRVAEEVEREALHALLVVAVGIHPVRVALGLPQRLLQVGGQAPGSIGHAPTRVWRISMSSVRSGAPSRRSGSTISSQRPTAAAHSSAIPASAPIRARTSPERLVSCVWLVSSARGKRACALGVGGVEACDLDAEARRVAAHVVEGEQAHVAVEGRVLDALGHDRRRRLLEAGHELAGALESATRCPPRAATSRSSGSARPSRT